jgi:hypothetical protein
METKPNGLPPQPWLLAASITSRRRDSVLSEQIPRDDFFFRLIFVPRRFFSLCICLCVLTSGHIV